MISLAFSISCMAFLTILAVFYFSKRKIINIDNRIYTSLLTINLIGIIIDITGFFILHKFGVEFLLNKIISKVYLIYYLTYVFTFMVYIYNVSFKNLQKVLRYMLTVLILVSVAILFLPINIYLKGNIAYSFGLSVNLAYIFGLLFMVIMVWCLLCNIRRIKSREYISLIIFVSLTLLTTLVQKINPQMTLLLLTNSVVTFLMYFTIENPDLQVLEEYNSIKELNVKRNIDKEIEIYNLRQRVRFPVMEIEERSRYLINNCPDSDFKKEVREIESLSKKTLLVINNLMNVSQMDDYYLRKSNNQYDVSLLLQEIMRSVKVLDGVSFNYHIDSNIPKILLGDNLYLKEALKKTIDLSVSNTLKGKININITAIIKDDICRLFIELSDTSKGYTMSELEKIYDDGRDYSEIKMLLDNLGGQIIINSEKGHGNDIIIILDQKIYHESDSKLEKINQAYQRKRILVVTQNNQIKKALEKEMKKRNFNVEVVDLGVTCLEKIRRHDQYDLIILDSDMEPLNGMDIFGKLLAIKNFNIDVMLMSDNTNFKMKGYYLDSGIKDIISLPIDKKQLREVLDEWEND